MLLDDIKKDIEYKIQTAMEHASKEILKEFKHAYNFSISKFYQDWWPDPNNYFRVFGLYNHAYNDILILKKNSFTAGIDVLPDLASSVSNHQPDSEVFDWAFNQGIHGSIYAPQTTSPDIYMLEYKNEIISKLPNIMHKYLKF